MALAGATFISLIFIFPYFFDVTYSAPSFLKESVVNVAQVPVFLVTHLKTPEPLKALYMTSCVAGTLSWRDSLKKLIETTELNAVVIDIKDYTGSVSFKETSKCFINDLRAFISELHVRNIYVIGRISVFQDPAYTKLFPELAVKKKSDGEVWKDYKGLSFIDVGARPYWDYIVDISKEAYALGFDEINYDYVRYPSDGNVADTLYTWTTGTTTKTEMLKSFFEYLHNELKDPSTRSTDSESPRGIRGATSSGQVPVLSVDLFGMTMTVTSDMNIGQVLELALPYFDYVSPMVYPSHYPATWNGFANPAEYPYEVVKISMSSAVKRETAWNLLQGLASTTPSKMRPWLQDFNLGATYGPDKVRAQIQATYDVGLTSWMLWNAGNKYTISALLPE